MKKTFSLTHPKIKVARLVETVKHDVKKYLKRERNKALPAGVDYWDFDCKYGPIEQEAEVIHVAEINKYLDEAERLGLESCYLEILATHGHRMKRQDSEPESSDSQELASEGSDSQELDSQDDEF